MDSGTSVIFNLGGLDEETQRFLGCLITVGFEVAALSRADMPEHERTQYHLVLDEFSMFSAQSEESLARVLSLARKYGLYLTLAHQTWSQVSARLQGALQNTVSIAFRLGRSDAEWAAKRFGTFDPYDVKHTVNDEQAEDRTHPVYFSVQETYERVAQTLEHLNPREALVKVGKRVQRIRTRPFPLPRATRQEITDLKDAYAHQLMTPRTAIVSQVDGTGAQPQRSRPPLTRRVPVRSGWRHDLYEVDRRDEREAA